jgi:hypothetical protein
METLRRLASLPPEKFRPTPPGNQSLRYIRAKVYTNQGPSFVAQQDGQASLLGKVRLPEEVNLQASLTLVCIPRDDMEYIKIDYQTFMDFFHVFRIDPRFLHLILTNRYGFHHERYKDRLSFYIGTVQYTLLWSFDPQTRKTCAILLLRDSNGYSRASKAYSELKKIIELEAAMLHTPFLLAWAVLAHLSNWIDAVTYTELTSIRQLEDTTGHGPYGLSKMTGEVKVEDLKRASENVGSMLANLSNQSRHVAIGTSIAAHLLAANNQSSYPINFATEPFHKIYRDELSRLSESVPTLQRSLTDSKAYVAYLQERARTQSSVVSFIDSVLSVIMWSEF